MVTVWYTIYCYVSGRKIPSLTEVIARLRGWKKSNPTRSECIPEAVRTLHSFTDVKATVIKSPFAGKSNTDRSEQSTESCDIVKLPYVADTEPRRMIETAAESLKASSGELQSGQRLRDEVRSDIYMDILVKYIFLRPLHGIGDKDRPRFWWPPRSLDSLWK